MTEIYLFFLKKLYIWRKVEKTNHRKFDEFIVKVDVKHFGCNKLLQDFKSMKNVVKIAIDVWFISNTFNISDLYSIFSLSVMFIQYLQVNAFKWSAVIKSSPITLKISSVLIPLIHWLRVLFFHTLSYSSTNIRIFISLCISTSSSLIHLW